MPMIIDVHDHVIAGRELGSYQSGLLNSRGFHGKGDHGITQDSVKRANWRGRSHADLLAEVGTDMAFLSPRPYTMMHSEKPEKIVHWYVEATNDATHAAVLNAPTIFRGIAGLPQCAGVSPTEHVRGDRPHCKRSRVHRGDDQPGPGRGGLRDAADG
jgi:OH-DDVA meta-cleavage compound hydrolase